MEENNLSTYTDDRLFSESGVEARIAQLIVPSLTSLGFRLVRINFSGLNGGNLQIMAEREDGSLTIDDCETISRSLSPILDVEDVIAQQYNLEISSPGIDRPLVRVVDFVRWQGHLAKVETINLIEDRKRFRGIIANVADEGFTLELDENDYGFDSILIPFDNYAEGRLILTDDLIKETLRKEKQKAKTNQNSEENEI